MDIICISTTDWDEIWGSRQQIMSCLADEGHRILFIERQVGPEHLLRDHSMRVRKLNAWKQSALRSPVKNIYLWQPPLLFPGRYYSTIFNRFGQSILFQRLKPILRQLNIQHPVLWLYPPHSAPLIGRFLEIISVYHCIERFIGGQSGIKRAVMEKQELALLKKVDLVFTHAEGLQRLYQPYTKRPIMILPSAADVQRFQSISSIHPDVQKIPQPRLGVVCTLDGRIDVDLLLGVATQQPDWHLVIIGPVRPGRINLDEFFSLPNVHYLGLRPFSDLPGYLNGIDVCLIPYVRNELTEYISPIKLFEYLAVGKPIVSVDLPEVKLLSQFILTAHNTPEFIIAVQNALAENSTTLQAARRKVAWEHTWETRAKQAWSEIAKVLNE